MEGYLEHVRSLRKHISDYEDKAAILSAEKHKHETAIRATEKDMELLDAESKRLDVEMDELVKQRGALSSSILKSQREIAKLDRDAAALSDALEAIKKDTVLQYQSLEKTRAHYNQLSEEQYAQFEMYKKAIIRSSCSEGEVAQEERAASETSAIMDFA